AVGGNATWACPARNAESGAAFPSTGAGARALFCTLARLTYRQLCGLVQRPSETGAVIANIGRCWSGDKANPGTVYVNDVASARPGRTSRDFPGTAGEMANPENARQPRPPW